MRITSLVIIVLVCFSVGAIAYAEQGSNRNMVTTLAPSSSPTPALAPKLSDAVDIYLEALKTQNKDAAFIVFNLAYNTIEDGYKTWKKGVDEFSAAVDMILPPRNEDETAADRADNARKLYGRYFKDEVKGMENFLNDLVKNGFATKSKNSYETDDDVTGREMGMALGMSDDAVKAMIMLLETYGNDFNWKSLFPQ